MSASVIRLTGSYWTLAGPVEILAGRQWSLFGFRERCAEAARAGFSGIGLWHADLEHLLSGSPPLTLAEIGQILADNGLAEIELEFLTDWFLDPGDQRRAASDAGRALLFEAAAALDAHHIKVGNLFGVPCPVQTVADRFAELCADAASRTSARIAYELMPSDPSVHSIASALRLADAAGPGGGIALDTWHLGKLGVSPADLRLIPARQLAWVELSDGRRASLPDFSDETINHRLLPGDGEFPVAGYVQACRDLGYKGPWGVEVLSVELRSLPMTEMYERAFRAAAAQFGEPLAVDGAARPEGSPA
jgi:sugar phosphate isomerase/epimerase